MPTTLSPGSRLGPYEIVAQLGVGGMGEVYRATDTGLRRQVAIKVLPASVARDAERLARFQREAEVLAVLNHPNIAHIHGLEKSDGTFALVMELAEGPTLADRIAQGPIPIDEALPIARQIAEALEAAHERGIVHRDLKPANIKVRLDGTVKVLDFGLAKAMEKSSVSGRDVPDLSASPTITTPAMTQAGMILGTAAYMSPEQARGRPVDRRADIWAFGCVLYEMLTGRRSFEGDDVADTVANVLKTEPDWSRLPSGMSAALRVFLRNCLQKDPAHRLRDVADVKLALDGAFDVPEPSRPAAENQRARWSLPSLAPWALAFALLIALAWSWRQPRTNAVVAPVLRASISIPKGATVSPSSQLVALSHDGSRVAFSAMAPDGRSRMWIRALGSPEAQLIANSENSAGWAFWSPGGETLAFESGGKLRLTDVVAGQSRVLCDANGFRGGDWAPDGTIVFAPTEGAGLFRIAASGGEPVRLTTLAVARGETSHRMPSFLPDGRRFLFRVQSPREDVAGIYLGSLDGGEKTRLVGTDSQALYVPQGYLLYVVNGTLFAHPFDVATARLKGAPHPLVQGIGFNATTGTAAFSASDTGAVTYRIGGQGFTPTELIWVNRTGQLLETLKVPPARYVNADLSFSGKVAVQGTDRRGTSDIWVIDTPGAPLRRVTFDPANDESPLWSPDESRLLFFSGRPGKGSLFLKSAAGAGDEQLLVESSDRSYPSGWSPDGTLIAYATRMPDTKWDLYVLKPDGDRTPQPYLRTPFNEQHAQFSPDGRWITYTSDESGANEVYVQSYPRADGTKLRISTNGGLLPRWRRDGRELFFVATDRTLMAVDISLSSTSARAGSPKPLFQVRWSGGQLPNPSGQTASYAASPDGQRFLTFDSQNPEAQAIDLILNWPALLN